MIIPAIDLIDGQVVRLYQGDYDKQTTFDLSPLAQLKSYQDQGAKLLHIVDLTGAKDPNQRQIKLISELVAGLDVDIQVGGGIRSEQQVTELLAIGVKRVVIGSLAVKEPELVKSWLNKYGSDAICLALDVNINANGEKIVAVSGWQSAGGKTLESLVAEFERPGSKQTALKHALVTDISRDGTLTGANTALYTELAAAYPTILWQASGGIATLDDVSAVKDSKAAGIIIGKALLINQFTVEEAIQCWPNA
ncbi:1-(5-phosphoribosyl)-5-[(5-phosphoribosylamino)methylideneamino] imidazole-4-carboxamide isomerase [Shewanella denitrificans OS217]|jgi:phosphoribosylformimino-5-aminoimidazole carboxamide ribotide isomerase|uniref:1-(5-phosphoribosyl)-5-[(5-phosphoribosylamino)methylideneamino] imidazole-4-carboxamide isomerase n=1 Tax=Shewanella denitrificans (strain OS217 / ATCC BAA-1090 / DSM 15013) TaxID=318161 RepID=HIS4_SHEDO|nr:1-(5-phosphoribosyl)-5-[(5-phosphoribosylamino)methylideneamino]imidazole-4-carboxamide isomerase [Shewanella denitrificans]Q12NS9.1 RecName: Full=1-(5-phosphoribosyl)-5-[(5-phosphoribosylamino)methylideneamino] imidazole-4-carboxamide isomerase; AltName: Full=Phosphoribosylformimino-5-aminoimidazole carboxamide ribotide isomerase [Shewanella denitrificans OS217]ABE54897.1 1-(5-phosphoribosyl)-5-[(5-phosphoribosylamino)methylideneamino] imidazole-4-carboxamide isomerase [Shewanella denitrifica